MDWSFAPIAKSNRNVTFDSINLISISFKLGINRLNLYNNESSSSQQFCRSSSWIGVTARWQPLNLAGTRSQLAIQSNSYLNQIAIDHYVQYDAKKAQHFQRKMTRLLADPDTLSLIQSKEPEKMTLLRSPRLATKSKIKEEVNKFNICSSEYIKNIIEQS